MRTVTRVALAAASLALGAAPAAAVTLTQDKSAFDAATAALSVTEESFDGFADEYFFTSIDAGPFTVEATGDVFFLLFSTFCRSGKCLTAFSPFTISFDSPVNAAGFFLGDGDGGGSRVLVDGADVGGITTPLEGFTFVGVYDLATPFSTVRLPDTVDWIFEIDDVSFAAASDTAAVPVPASLPLLLAGIAGLGLAGARRRG